MHEALVECGDGPLPARVVGWVTGGDLGDSEYRLPGAGKTGRLTVDPSHRGTYRLQSFRSCNARPGPAPGQEAQTARKSAPPKTWVPTAKRFIHTAIRTIADDLSPTDPRRCRPHAQHLTRLFVRRRD